MAGRPRILLLYPYGPCDLVRVPDSVELVTLTEDGDLGWPGEVATGIDAELADAPDIRAAMLRHVRDGDVLIPVASITSSSAIGIKR